MEPYSYTDLPQTQQERPALLANQQKKTNISFMIRMSARHADKVLCEPNDSGKGLVALPQWPDVGCAPIFPASQTTMFLPAQSPCLSPSMSPSATLAVAQHDCAINRRRRSVLFAFTFSPHQGSR
ncbi:hypothetical protein KHO49_11060 [Pseudomonas sp. RC4D1]|uniref:hypothetical protein n=1 Tax=Pseudomonas TaxID=286 RepID=UPI0011B79667|nr:MULTISPECIES: hypothetical protein [Pseudomonas]MBS7558899.1 hypothetical protein [Pseudomonas sp. RC4D1]